MWRAEKENSADSRRGSGNTHISVSETEAAELCRVDIILAEDSLKTGRRTRVWSIYWCQDQVVHYISFNLLRFSIRAKLKCFTSATKRATSLSTEYNLLLLLLLFILKMSTVDSSEICLETQTWTVVWAPTLMVPCGSLLFNCKQFYLHYTHMFGKHVQVIIAKNVFMYILCVCKNIGQFKLEMFSSITLELAPKSRMDWALNIINLTAIRYVSCITITGRNTYQMQYCPNNNVMLSS